MDQAPSSRSSPTSVAVLVLAQALPFEAGNIHQAQDGRGKCGRCQVAILVCQWTLVGWSNHLSSLRGVTKLQFKNNFYLALDFRADVSYIDGRLMNQVSLDITKPERANTDRFNQLAGKHSLVKWLAIPCQLT